MALPTAEAAHQVHAIKAALEDELGRAITGFCYPGGDHDAVIRDLVRPPGFTMRARSRISRVGS